LADRHRRLAWWLARRDWNLRTWRNIHWSDASWFLLHVTDGRMRVWRHKYTAYAPRNIHPTVPYGGGSVMVWGCISHDCKLDLVTIQGNLTGDQYIRDSVLKRMHIADWSVQNMNPDVAPAGMLLSVSVSPEIVYIKRYN
jgi:hypothetical protein